MKIKRNSPYFKGTIFDVTVINFSREKCEFYYENGVSMDYSSGISEKVTVLENV